MENSNHAFHKFSQLPPELREEIWTYCLPSRSLELDLPSHKAWIEPLDSPKLWKVLTEHEMNELAWFDEWLPHGQHWPTPCELSRSSRMNRCAPVLARVCHEARSVALKAGQMPVLDPSLRQAEKAWAKGTYAPDAWRGLAHDLTHLNRVVARGRQMRIPLLCLIREAERTGGRGALYPDLMPWLIYEPTVREVVKALESVLVVMQIVVVHAPFALAAQTGLFGLLGDAPVQILDVADEPKVSALFELAKACEFGHPVRLTQKQFIFRTAVKDIERDFEEEVVSTFPMDDELRAKMRPAVMFRLCPDMCNHQCKSMCDHQQPCITDEVKET